jgi:hypothetical protein
MAGCCQEQIGEQGESTDSGCSAPKHAKSNDAREKSGEHQRVSESTMSPEVAVMDAEAKPDHVEVGDYGARHVPMLRAATACEKGEAILFVLFGTELSPTLRLGEDAEYFHPRFPVWEPDIAVFA